MARVKEDEKDPDGKSWIEHGHERVDASTFDTVASTTPASRLAVLSGRQVVVAKAGVGTGSPAPVTSMSQRTNWG